MISKLPRWVEAGAFSLALLAGSVNAVGLLGFQHQSVSHLSGTATLLGVELLGWGEHVGHLAGILLSFMVGALVSGVLIGGTALQLGRRYSVALFLEGGLLVGAMLCLQRDLAVGHYLASAACGLQNALVTTYSGALIRTTHMTGLFTDLGIMLGLRLRGQPFDRRRAVLYLLIITAFVLGGALGALLFARMNVGALLVPGMMAVTLGLLYILLVQRKTRRGTED